MDGGQGSPGSRLAEEIMSEEGGLRLILPQCTGVGNENRYAHQALWFIVTSANGNADGEPGPCSGMLGDGTLQGIEPLFFLTKQRGWEPRCLACTGGKRK